jgi:hypothetical protein
MICVVDMVFRPDPDPEGQRLTSSKKEYTTLDDLPSSTTSTHIRENTFYSKDRETCWWPHLKNRKHAVNPQNVRHTCSDDWEMGLMWKLAKAGFVFTPSGPGSDAVKCTMCDYDVEYWDEDDDPL